MGELETKGVQEQGKYNAIAVEMLPTRTNGKQDVKRYTITDDLDMIDHLVQSDNFIIASPISYAGKSRESRNARYIYGLAIDLDGVETKQHLADLIHQMGEVDYLPKATYLVASGSGIHLYYLFRQPIPCFKNITMQLATLKTALVKRIWNQYTTTLSNHVQIQSLFQGFRMVGTITKYGTRVRAFEVGDRVTIEYLNQFVDDKSQAKNFTYKSKLTLSEAKIKYPEWYEKRIEQKQRKGTWTCKRDLYEWWKKKLYFEIREGHRYYGIMCLSVYAKKCGISYDELCKDAYSMLEDMEKLTTSEDNHFTDSDITAALEMYNDNYITFPIKTIADITQIPIEKNKRNYRKQSVHLKIARSTLNIMNEEAGHNKQGRPTGSGTKEQAVQEWKAEHPQGSKAECIRDTGMSKPTVYRYWN